MELGLKGKVALVTGASKGIGLAAAKALFAEGCHVGVCARTPETLAEAKAAIEAAGSGRVFAYTGDMGNVEDIYRFVNGTASELGGIDILVNSAGSASPGGIQTLTDEQWQQAINLKVMGYIRAMRAVIPQMKKRGGGQIINVAGSAGKQPDSWMVCAGTVNAAVLTITRAAATELAPENIRVNAVCPGPTGTQRWDGMKKVFADYRGLDQAKAEAEILANIPMGRVGTSSEVADLIVFLASDRAAYITGTSVAIDGGQTKGV